MQLSTYSGICVKMQGLCKEWESGKLNAVRQQWLCSALLYTMWRAWFIKCDVATCCKSKRNGVSEAGVLLGELWEGLFPPGRWPTVNTWMDGMLECTCRHIYTCTPTPTQTSHAHPYLHQLWGTSWHSQNFHTGCCSQIETDPSPVHNHVWCHSPGRPHPMICTKVRRLFPSNSSKTPAMSRGQVWVSDL